MKNGNAGAIKGLCALVGILIFVTMGKLLEQSEGSNQLIWGLGGGGLLACYLVYKLAGDKD